MVSFGILRSGRVTNPLSLSHCHPYPKGQNKYRLEVVIPNITIHIQLIMNDKVFLQIKLKKLTFSNSVF
jgi:hypothetical protein